MNLGYGNPSNNPGKNFDFVNLGYHLGENLEKGTLCFILGKNRGYGNLG